MTRILKSGIQLRTRELRRERNRDQWRQLHAGLASSEPVMGAITREIAQTYLSEPSPEVHQGAVYWIIDTDSFDRGGHFTLVSPSYVSPKHEDLEFPVMAAEGNFFDGGNGEPSSPLPCRVTAARRVPIMGASIRAPPTVG